MSRQGFWLRHLFAVPAALALTIAAQELTGVLELAASAALTLFLVSIWSRRLHDRDRWSVRCASVSNVPCARAIREYPFNAGYHLTVSVIGTSTTVEYDMKRLYEHSVGRLSKATRTGSDLTPEDRFAAKAAQDYVDFIRVDPWHLFDFKSRLTQLWQLSLSGPNTIRRFERCFAVTSEFLAKEGYAKVIKFATRSIYEAPKHVTAIVLDRMPSTNHSYSEIKVLTTTGDEIIATIPRYEAFTDYSRWLAAEGGNIHEIVGNRGEVVVSLLVPVGYQSPIPTARAVLAANPDTPKPAEGCAGYSSG